MSSVSLDTSKLDGLMDALKGSGSVKVGILGDSAERGDGNTNAEIGLAHEFGSQSKNIPPRSFIRMPLETNVDSLKSAMQGSAAKKAVETGDTKSLLELLGIQAQGIIQEAFSTGGYGQWPANSAATVARKGYNSPLQETGQLKRSITYKVESNG